MATTAARVRRTIAALAAVGAVGGLGAVMASFTATTTNPGNSIATGTVAIGDSDGSDVAMYTAALDGGLAADEKVERCITVTYTGSLPAEVRLYAAAPVTGAEDFHVEVGTLPDVVLAPFPGCGGADSDDAALVFSQGLQYLPTSWASGFVTSGPWTQGESRTFYISVRAYDEDTPNERTTASLTGDHTYVWEARNV